MVQTHLMTSSQLATGGHSDNQISERRKREQLDRVSDLRCVYLSRVYPLIYIGNGVLTLQVSRARQERMTSLVTASVT